MLCMQTNTHTNNRKDCINVHIHIETQIGKEVGFCLAEHPTKKDGVERFDREVY